MLSFLFSWFVFLFGNRGEVFFPFHGKEVFLLCVALLTGRHHISFCRLSSSYNRNNMVHGEFIRGKMPVAVVTDSLGASPFPPFRLAQRAGFLPLPPYMGIITDNCKRFRRSRIPFHADTLIECRGYFKAKGCSVAIFAPPHFTSVDVEKSPNLAYSLISISLTDLSPLYLIKWEVS
jgi:hypothetical protein